MVRNTALLILFVCIASIGRAQLPPGLSFSGYVDAYLAYYTDSLASGDFQKFPTYAPRSNSIGLNIAQLNINYKAEKVRALITLHSGDIPNSSWSQKYNMVQEANAGIRLHKKLWLDAGFFRTHIGAEGLYPKENITSSIAIVTLYEPYYQAGLKLTWQITPKLEGRIYLLNGYNVFEDNNKKKSVGMLVTYVFNDACNIVYANYIGDDTPDTISTSHTRFYNNLVFNYDKNKLRFTAGLDFAVQAHSDLETGNKSGTTFGGLLAVRYTVHKNLNLYVRGEAFNDQDGFLAGTFINSKGKSTPLHMMGGTIGLEYKPTGTGYIRLEGRNLKAYDDVKPFYWDKELRDSRYEAIFSMGVWF